MKKILYITLLFLAWGCEKSDVFIYDQPKSSIQFDYEPGDVKLDYDFAFQYDVFRDQWGYENYVYFGDSLRRDTIDLYLSVLGVKDDMDREFSLKLVPVKGQDSTMLAEVELLPPYHFKAGQFLDTIQVVLVRPEKRGKYTIGITFDLNDNSSFALGVEEQNIYQINIIDRYPEPSDWQYAEYFLGKYSEEKYAFYVTVLHKPLKSWAYWDKAELIEALDAYNAAHPDAPKDFSFPE